jgi:hypothetical protein
VEVRDKDLRVIGYLPPAGNAFDPPRICRFRMLRPLPRTPDFEATALDCVAAEEIIDIPTIPMAQGEYNRWFALQVTDEQIPLLQNIRGFRPAVAS